MASTFTQLIYHIVFSTKYRDNRITAELQPDLYSYLGGIIRNLDGSIIEIGGMPDHVHILARLSAKIAVADVVQKVKANSSKWLNERDDVADRFQWQRGYAAFSVSRSLVPHVRSYVHNQLEHHRQRTFQEEFLSLLRKHGIEFDEQYVFDVPHFG